jgi:hypothetical protein
VNSSVTSVHARRRRAHPLWRMLALPVGLVFMIGSFLLGMVALLQLQVRLAPDTPVFCTPTPVATIALFLAMACVAIPLGLLIANVVLWLLPFTHGSSDVGRTFGQANAGLTRLMLALGVVAVPVCAVAINSETCISPAQVYYRPTLLAGWQTYGLSQISEVRPRCARSSRGGWDLGVELALNDGTVVDLATVGPWFSAAANRIMPLLRGARVNPSGIAADCPSGLRQIVLPPSLAGSTRA